MDSVERLGSIKKYRGFCCRCQETEEYNGLSEALSCSTRKAARSVFGDGFGAFRDGVLGQFTGENEADGGLDFAARQGGFLVVAAQFASFGGDALEDVVDERVHDGHGALGDAGVGVNLIASGPCRRTRCGPCDACRRWLPCPYRPYLL